MTVYCLDTSALVKRYVLETGTAWITRLTSPAARHDLYVVRLAGPEMIAALFRKVRTGEVSRAEATRAAANFRLDWQRQYQILEVTPGLADRAMSLAERYGLRGYDAVHLAAALELQAARLTMRLPTLTFVSADGGQLHVAAAEGLLIEDPNAHL